MHVPWAMGDGRFAMGSQLGSHRVLHVLVSGVSLMLILPMLLHGRHASLVLCHNNLRQQLAPAALPPALAVG